MPDVCIIPMQQKLYDLYDSGNLRRPIGAYGALTSAANRTANPVQVSLVGAAKPGHNAKYQITYVEAECDAVIECGEEGSGICDAGSSNNVQTDVKTISHCINLKNIELTLDQFRDLCNYGPNDFLMAQLVGRLDTGMRSINATINTVLCANVGCYAEAGDSDTPRDVALLTSSQTPVFGALRPITQAYRQAGLDVDPILIGGDALDMYAYGQEYGGQTANGSNFREPRFPIFYDNQLSGICPIENRETMLALAPGVAQMVTYLENVNEFATGNTNPMDILGNFKRGETYQFGVLEDPITGHMWDISAVLAPCNKKWIINIKSTFDVWVMRLTQCYADCFTGIQKYGVCNLPAVTCGGGE